MNLKIGKHSSFKDTSLGQNILDRLCHTLHSTQKCTRVAGNWDSILLQAVLDITRSSIPSSGGLAHDRDDLETSSLPFGEFVYKTEIVRGLDSVIQASRSAAVSSTANIEQT
jgi:hypothetical protein